jgi:hypothetical protein
LGYEVYVMIEGEPIAIYPHSPSRQSHCQVVTKIFKTKRRVGYVGVNDCEFPGWL